MNTFGKLMIWAGIKSDSGQDGKWIAKHDFSIIEEFELINFGRIDLVTQCTKLPYIWFLLKFKR